VLLEHLSAKGIDFYLPLDLETRALKPKIESADTSKQ
jgi:hypothetical protein